MGPLDNTEPYVVNKLCRVLRLVTDQIEHTPRLGGRSITMTRQVY